MTENRELKMGGAVSMCTRWVVRIVPVICVVVLGASLSPAIAEDESAVRETGRLIAVLLDAGRVTIGSNQLLLNDPTKGDKGFTPEVFAKQTVAAFKERTGYDLSNLATATVPEMSKPLLARLLEESKKTVASYQSVINVPGIKYKGLIPATFGTETGGRFQTWSGVYLKQTAPEHLVRNPKNKPDAFEAAEMKKMGEPSFPREGEQVVSAIVEEGKSMRVLLPLFYGKNCLSCHGAPKGERDVTGYPREGAREGDLGGAISVKFPMP
jgi:general secretion pathway protein A